MCLVLLSEMELLSSDEITKLLQDVERFRKQHADIAKMIKDKNEVIARLQQQNDELRQEQHMYSIDAKDIEIARLEAANSLLREENAQLACAPNSMSVEESEHLRHLQKDMEAAMKLKNESLIALQSQNISLEKEAQILRTQKIDLEDLTNEMEITICGQCSAIKALEDRISELSTHVLKLFPPSTLVWAQPIGYPWWPSKIVEASALTQTVMNSRPKEGDYVPVYFLGSHDHAWIGPEFLLPFDSNFEMLKCPDPSELRSQRDKLDFAKALNEIGKKPSVNDPPIKSQNTQKRKRMALENFNVNHYSYLRKKTLIAEKPFQSGLVTNILSLPKKLKLKLNKLTRMPSKLRSKPPYIFF